MKEPGSYFTIKNSSEGSFRDRGSKFLAYAYPVTTQEEIKQHLTELKKEHPSANHHCYAWKLGAVDETMRANDDGEPSSSAGKPILAQIQAKELTNILVVVVRYFGGTLLGVNGLINAYKNAAADALVKAVTEQRFILNEYSVEFGFDDVSAVMRLLKEYEATIISNTYDETNRIVFRVKRHRAEQVEKRFAELYRTKLELMADEV